MEGVRKCFLCAVLSVFTLLFFCLVTHSFQGMSAWTTCQNIQVICTITVPDVSDAPTVTPTAVYHTHKQTQGPEHVLRKANGSCTVYVQTKTPVNKLLYLFVMFVMPTYVCMYVV